MVSIEAQVETHFTVARASSILEVIQITRENNLQYIQEQTDNTSTVHQQATIGQRAIVAGLWQEEQMVVAPQKGNEATKCKSSKNAQLLMIMQLQGLA